MKKWLSVFIFLASISFVSAQNNFSDLLNSIDQTTLILYAVFILSFTILFFSLNHIFKNDKTTSGIISAVISLLIVYGVNKSGLDIQGFIFDLGISQDVLATAIPIILIAGIILMVINLKKDSLIVVGGLLIAASFFVYEQTLLIAVGVILVMIRFFIPKGKWERKKKNSGSGYIRG
jgi:hypothetical protein